MALEIHSLYATDITDLINEPEKLERVSITHDGISVSYVHDEKGWYTFEECASLMDHYACECLDLTPETVIAEIIRAIALSREETVEFWLS